MDGEVYTNGIEFFWVLLKPGYVGTYHRQASLWATTFVRNVMGRRQAGVVQRRGMVVYELGIFIVVGIVILLGS